MAASGDLRAAYGLLGQEMISALTHLQHARGKNVVFVSILDEKLDDYIGAKHSKIKLRAKPREFDFAPGTILQREWGEREHRVTVTAEGLFEYQGRNFKSLTAVARHITGAHWSGPLFFGLSKGGAR